MEGRLTNGYGNTPSTSLLTIPSDNKPLYYLGGSFKPSRVDTKFIPLNKNDKLMLFGGVLSDNAEKSEFLGGRCVPQRGKRNCALSPRPPD